MVFPGFPPIYYDPGKLPTIIPGSLDAQYVHVNWFKPYEITASDMGTGLIPRVLRWWHETGGNEPNILAEYTFQSGEENNMVQTSYPPEFGIIYEPFLIHTA